MIKISIIIPVYNVEQDRFRKTLESLKKQTNKHFEICISDGGLKKSVEKIIEEYKNELDIKYKKSKINLGISKNTNEALKLATGDYIALLDHDDRLEQNAIQDVINEIEEKKVDWLYSDEQIVDDKGKIINKFYKPDLSIDLLYSQNYICHFLVVKREIIKKIGNFNEMYDGAQDYDFVLRLVEETKNCFHIPKILYNWLATKESTSTNSDSKPYAQEAGLRALDAHLKRVYGKNVQAEETENLFVYRPKFNNLKNQKIDIIIPMKDKWYLTEQCVYSILKNTKYQNFMITIINNRSEEKLTYEWFKDVKKKDKRIRILEADFEFNWSKLQNFGIDNSEAEAFIFLNNDTVIIDENWLNVLVENALRDEVGVVGPLLCYEDGTIQHAGVVVGLQGYADHIFKGMQPIHANINYVSPMVSRNVLAVTGACMAISRSTIEKIGNFNEDFIICGSDVEICLRAFENGLRNIYMPNTKLIHLESKSRDTYIPEIDFKMSKIYYQKYWINGDPFFNSNLSYNSCIPIESNQSTEIKKQKNSNIQSIKKILKRSKIITKSYTFLKKFLRKNVTLVKIYRKFRHISSPINESIVNNKIVIDYTIPEIKKIIPIKCQKTDKKRINILIPSLNKEKVFGGISTAMKFFEQFDNQHYNKRIIITDTEMHEDDLEKYPDYLLIDNKKYSENKFQVVNIADSNNCNLLVAENDIFIATAWWTAYNIKNIIKWQKEEYKMKKYNSLIYFIQDYEPYFYPWGSRQACAESTYNFEIPTVAIFNSQELKQYFYEHNYEFFKTYSFDPILNEGLKSHLLNDSEKKRKKQIIVYGRPSVARNAFEIIEESLIKAFENRTDASEWKLISMGEDHYPAKINENITLISVGKLTIDKYAEIMEESYMGISLMISPHPSYPPLEMSSFGVKTITNQYENKDMSYFNENIISVKQCNPDSISKEIIKLLDNFSESSKKVINEKYVNASNQFNEIIKDIEKNI